MPQPSSPITWMRVARETAGLTQAQLAKRVARTQPQVSRWESGERMPRMLIARELARVLAVPVDRLFAEELHGTPGPEAYLNAFLRPNGRGQPRLATSGSQDAPRSRSKGRH